MIQGVGLPFREPGSFHHPLTIGAHLSAVGWISYGEFDPVRLDGRMAACVCERGVSGGGAPMVIDQRSKGP